MSCSFPSQYKNPAKYFDVLRDRAFITTNCGKCLSCQNAKKSDWQVRLYYEWLGTKYKGGEGLICTLTYNDAALPLEWLPSSLSCQDSPVYSDDGELLVIGKKVERKFDYFPCFSKEDLQKLIRFLRNISNIKVDGVYKFPDFNFKYFITCEYGDAGRTYTDSKGRVRTTTHRPHYHVLFYVIGMLPSVFKGFVDSFWNKYGFSCWSLPKNPIPGQEPGVIDGAGAIGYASKYVCKDFANDAVLRSALARLPENASDDLKKKVTPFHLQSSKLGLCIKDICSADAPELFRQGKVKVPDAKDGVKIVKLPLYVERKLYCTQDNPQRSYIYTEEGKELKAQRILELRNSMINEMRELLSRPNDFIDEEILDEINDVLGTRFLRPLDYVYFLVEQSKGLSIQQLIDYSMLFKDMIVTDDHRKQLETNSHYVFRIEREDFAQILLDDEHFKQLVRYTLDKDRTVPFEPKAFDKIHWDLFISQLTKRNIPHADTCERALKILNAYYQALDILGWHAALKKSDLWKTHNKTYKQNLYRYG